MITTNCYEYIGGKYSVRCSTESGKGFVTLCDTEEEARAFGNEQWKKPWIVQVSIIYMRFRNKKRNSLLIATAKK